MRRLIIGLFTTFTIAACSQASAPTTPSINPEVVAHNRSVITACANEHWQPCAGGFVHDGDLFQVIVVFDDTHLSNSDSVQFDQVRSTNLQAMTLQNDADDAYLSRVTIVLPGEPLWQQTAVAHARQRLEQQQATN